MKVLDDDNGDNYDNGNAPSAALSAFVSTGCGAATGYGGVEGHRILMVAGNVLNEQQRTSDNGCPAVW
jgi:hypothetical protein